LRLAGFALPLAVGPPGPGGGVPALGGASAAKRKGGGVQVGVFAPDSVELGRGGGATPLLEGTTEAARGGSGIAVAPTLETPPVPDLPGDAV
jgi:hypothetical protein